MTSYTTNVLTKPVVFVVFFYLSHGSDKGIKIRFVSTGENCGKPCLVCKKSISIPSENLRFTYLACKNDIYIYIYIYLSADFLFEQTFCQKVQAVKLSVRSIGCQTFCQKVQADSSFQYFIILLVVSKDAMKLICAGAQKLTSPSDIDVPLTFPVTSQHDVRKFIANL